MFGLRAKPPVNKKSVCLWKRAFPASAACSYALARFAKHRGEIHPPWIAHLSTNLKVYFRRCAEWLEQDARPIR